MANSEYNNHHNLGVQSNCETFIIYCFTWLREMECSLDELDITYFVSIQCKRYNENNFLFVTETPKIIRIILELMIFSIFIIKCHLQVIK